ncbi:MAG: DUF362 domain-containing protein [Phycisphaerae bacterium]|nr:DUF362 domain-containing protein [Phycisphaerae bacterium]
MGSRCRNSECTCEPLTRRGFLAGTGVAAALSLAEPGLIPQALSEAWAKHPDRREDPLSKVVEVRSDHVIVGESVHPELLRQMLRIGLAAVTGIENEKQAWQSLLTPDDVIGLKFNQSGAEGLKTTQAMAKVLVASLVDSGWDPRQLVTLEIHSRLNRELGTTPPSREWQPDEVQFGEARDRLSKVLEQVTAIVNIPFLKHHNIAGITCCLKNLSHALVKHPARFHSNKCSPYIGDIVALPQIRRKLRLHVVNALRIVIDNGPEARPPYIRKRGGLLLGVDPVAVDAIALELLNRVRLGEGLGKVEDRQGEVAYLSAAAARGLGRHELHQIDYVRHRL